MKLADSLIFSAAAAGSAARGSKAEQVYADVKEAILSGALEPGAAIDKSALCERLGVSRFPVSTAVNRLAYERLVTIEPQHGSFVAKIAAADVREWLMIRRAVETEIAGQLAKHFSPASRAAFDRNLRYQKAAAEAGDPAGFYALDVEFHRLIATCLELQQTAEILEGLRSHLERVRRLLLQPQGRPMEAYGEHHAIVAAFEAGDAEAARVQTRGHLEQTTQAFENFVVRRPALFSA